MNFGEQDLHLDVGLKYDESVIFGKENVADFIRKHHHKFENLNLEPIRNSHMLYGYNEDGNPIKIGYEEDLIRRIIIITTPVDKKRYMAVIAYDGHQYNGFQIQKGQDTIQGELTKVVSSINGYVTLIQGASRTDTGVHANNLVIHFDTIREFRSSYWLELLNHQLPNDISVKSIEETHPIFHSRYDVYKKKYIYKLKCNTSDPFRINYEWSVTNVDLDILKDNLTQLIGSHNFLSFCKGNPDSPIRTIYNAEMVVDGDNVQLIFEGNGFLRYMIRIIVYALVQISSHKLEMTISDILQEKSRKHTKHLAPASGLYLDEITY